MNEQQSASNMAVEAVEISDDAQVRRIEAELLINEEDTEKTAGVISSFVESYEANKDKQPLQEWLADEFRKYPDIWKDDAEVTQTAQVVVTTVQRCNDKKVSLQQHLDSGKSKESWLAKSIEDGAKAAGVVQVGEYAGKIERALEQANYEMADTVFNKRLGAETEDLVASMNPNLDGFIAEQHHVDTFNIDAASQGSDLRARVLAPALGETYGKNSMDIGVYDGNGKLVQRYQVKYGKNGATTLDQFIKGDYRGQRKLVADGHEGEVPGSANCIEVGGVKSTPLSKAEAKELQIKAQSEAETKQYQWNEVNRINIAKQIGKQAVIGAGMTAAFHGARIMGRRAWNALTGKQNRSASEDLKEFFESSIKSGANVGVQVAVSGGVVVAVKSGWMGNVLRNSPLKTIVNAVYAGMENAKVIYKFAKGNLSGLEAIDAMGNINASTVGGLIGAETGAGIGATIGAILGPVGAFTGGVVGGIVGGMAGSKIGQALYEGGKAIVKTGIEVVKTVWKGLVEGAKSVLRAFNPFSWFA